MKKRVIIATKNRGKAREFVEMFADLKLEVLTLLDLPEESDIEETGTTFAENAALKAEAIAKKYDAIVIADDSGLVIDALDGRPGIYSARYAGENKDDEANIDKVLDEMKHIPSEKRTARFLCVLALSVPQKDLEWISGSCEGKILFSRQGTNGFGYDPIFYVEEKGKSMAQLSPEEKNQISHRANAMRKLKKVLGTILGE
jgi:XTP/dITP diphosphohydrolase